jgi:putative membrane protein
MPATLPVNLGLILVALVYLRGWNHLRNATPNVILAWRAVAFLAGLLVVWIAAGSPLAMLDEQLLSVHMVQHLLLMTAAAPLILLSSPVLPLLHGLPTFAMRRPLLRLAMAQRVGSVLANPVFCWLVSTAILIGWHVPAAFALALGSESWHRVEHASFLAAGLLFWWPVIPSWPSLSHPRWSLVVYLFLATLPCDALSAFLAFCGRVVYSSYLVVPRRFDISPLEDQQCAGALMWVWVTFAYLIPAVAITTCLLSSPDHYERH